MTEPAGIYVHLPFCASRCPYCTFVISTDESIAPEYQRWLLAEVDLAAGVASDTLFDTIYLGGGTPSRTPAGRIDELLDRLRSRFRVAPAAEVTAEANPEDITSAVLASWKESGINRVSLGVQSFDDRVLQASGRGHSGPQARRAIEETLRAGHRVSVDLIAGLPGATARAFESDVELLATSGVGHASIYLLEVDAAHPVAEDRKLRPDRYLSDDLLADAYLFAASRLAVDGFEHYEVSSFARPGERSRHNTKYWTRTPTLGLGAGAHELWNEERRANTASLPLYGREVKSGHRSRARRQSIDAREALRERILLGLRTSDGVAEEDLSSWIAGAAPSVAGDWDEIERSGLSLRREGRVRMTERGFLLLSEVLCRIA